MKKIQSGTFSQDNIMTYTTTLGVVDANLQTTVAVKNKKNNVLKSAPVLWVIIYARLIYIYLI